MTIWMLFWWAMRSGVRASDWTSALVGDNTLRILTQLSVLWVGFYLLFSVFHFLFFSLFLFLHFCFVAGPSPFICQQLFPVSCVRYVYHVFILFFIMFSFCVVFPVELQNSP